MFLSENHGEYLMPSVLNARARRIAGSLAFYARAAYPRNGSMFPRSGRHGRVRAFSSKICATGQPK